MEKVYTVRELYFKLEQFMLDGYADAQVIMDYDSIKMLEDDE